MSRHQEPPRPFVSIVVPCFNEGERIDRLLESLLSQSYPKASYEIIIVDNRSTDDTAARARRYPGVRLLREDQLQNADAARNLGIAQATGDILAFTDGDCLPAANWLAAGVEALEKHQADAVAGKIQFSFSATKSCAEIYDSIANLQHDLSVEERGIAFTANLFVRRIWFDRCGTFPVGCGGDHELTRSISRTGGRLIFADNAIVLHAARPLGALLKKAARIGREKSFAAVHRRQHPPSTPHVHEPRTRELPPHLRLLSPRRLARRLHQGEHGQGGLRIFGIYLSGVMYVGAGALSYVAWRARRLTLAAVGVPGPRPRGRPIHRGAEISDTAQTHASGLPP